MDALTEMCLVGCGLLCMGSVGSLVGKISCVDVSRVFIVPSCSSEKALPAVCPEGISPGCWRAEWWEMTGVLTSSLLILPESPCYQ